MTSNVGERIAGAIKQRGYTIQRLSDEISRCGYHMPRRTLNGYVLSQSRPSKRVLELIEQILFLHPEYLLTGQGSPLEHERASAAYQAANTHASASAAALERRDDSAVEIKIPHEPHEGFGPDMLEPSGGFYGEAEVAETPTQAFDRQYERYPSRAAHIPRVATPAPTSDSPKLVAWGTAIVLLTALGVAILGAL